MEDRNLDIGYIFDRTFTVLGARFGELSLLALVFVGLPTLLIGLLSGTWTVPGGDYPGMHFSPGLWLVNLILGMLPLLLQAAAIHTTVEALAGRPSDFGRAVSVALSVFLPLIVLSILLSLGYFIGFLLLIIPGLILMTVWAVTVPAFVAERTGIFGAFSRSMELTEGQRWRIFGLMVIVWIAFMVVGAVLAAIGLGIGAGVAAYGDPASFTLGAVITQAIVSMATSTVGAVGVSVLYVHLRDLKEGSGLETISDTFR